MCVDKVWYKNVTPTLAYIFLINKFANIRQEHDMLKNGFEQYPVCKNLTGPLCGKMGGGEESTNGIRIILVS